MKNPISQDILTAYLDGELTPDEQAVAERLLRDSQEHRQLLDDLRAVRSRLQALPIRVPDASLAERILEQAERIARQRREVAVPVATPVVDRKSGWFRVAVACLGLAASLLLVVVLFRGRGTELARDTRDLPLPAEPMAASSNRAADQTMSPDTFFVQPTAEHDNPLVRSRAGDGPVDRMAGAVERYRSPDGTSPARKDFAERGTELHRQSATQDELRRRLSESQADKLEAEAKAAAAARPATMPSAAKTAVPAPQSAAPALAPQSAAVAADKEQDRRNVAGAAAQPASQSLAEEPARLGSAGLGPAGRGGAAGRGMLPPGGAPAAAKGADAPDSAKGNRRQVADADPMFGRLDVRVVNVVPIRMAGENRLASVEKLLQDNQIQLVQRDAEAAAAIGDAERLALRELKRNPADPIDVYYIEGSAEQVQGLLRDLAGQPDLVHEMQPPRPLDVYRRGEPLSKLAVGDERAPRKTPSDPAGAAADSPQPLQEKLSQRGRALKLSNSDALEKAQAESNQTFFQGLSPEAGRYRLMLMIRTEPRKSGEVPRVEADNPPPR